MLGFDALSELPLSTAINVVTGSMAVTESGGDSFSAAGDVLIIGSVSAVESGSDTLSAVGYVVVSGLLAATETGDDSFAAAGTTVAADEDPSALWNYYIALSLHIKRERKRRNKTEEAQDLHDIYEEIVESAPEVIKEEAVKTVRKFAMMRTKPSVSPTPSIIDWEKLADQQKKVAVLLKLWQKMKEIEEDDEDDMLLMAA